MSKEKTDEFLSWRGRLAPPDALPDQGLDDKEVSWERLADRLRENPRRRTGYWIAAACLLLAMIPATHFFRDRPARGAGVARVNHLSLPRPTALPQSSRRQPTTDQTTSDHSPATTTAIGPSVTISSLAARSRHKRTGATPSRPPARAPILALIASPDDHPSIIAEAALPLTGDSVGAMIARQPAPRKKLRVVQINEINNSAGPAPTIATRFQSPFRIGLGVPESGAPDDQASRPGNTSLLKIKLSSQNH